MTVDCTPERRAREAPPLRIEYLRIPAVIDGDRAMLVNADGKPLRKGIPLDQIAELSPEGLEMATWHPCAQRLLQRANHAAIRAEEMKDSWYRKAQSLAKSFSLRGRRQPARKETRRHMDRYRTRTWREAAARIAQQANSRRYRHQMDPWRRWALTVVSNANKRAGSIA